MLECTASTKIQQHILRMVFRHKLLLECTASTKIQQHILRMGFRHKQYIVAKHMTSVKYFVYTLLMKPLFFMRSWDN